MIYILQFYLFDLVDFLCQFDYDKFIKLGFSDTPEVKLPHYTSLYWILASESFQTGYLANIISIAMQLKIGEKSFLPMINNKEGPALELHIKPDLTGAITWDSFKNIMNKSDHKPEHKAVVEVSEDKFKLYMQTVCFMLLRIIFKDTSTLINKYNKLQDAINLTGIGKDLCAYFLKPSDTLCKFIRNQAKNHRYRPPIANICLQAFIKQSDSGIRSFMQWNFLRDCKYLNTGVIKYTIESMVILNLSEHDYFDCFLDEKSVIEIIAIHNILKKIYRQPKKSSAEYDKWVYYTWGGMMYEDLWPEVRTHCTPRSTSVALGVLETMLDKKIELPSFKENARWRIYYRIGEEMARSRKIDETTTAMNALDDFIESIKC